MIPGDLLSAFPHRQFHTLPGLLDSWAALPNSNPNACREAVCTIFMMVFGMTQPRGELTTYRARGHEALDRNPELEFNMLLVQLISRDIFSVCPY